MGLTPTLTLGITLTLESKRQAMLSKLGAAATDVGLEVVILGVVRPSKPSGKELLLLVLEAGKDSPSVEKVIKLGSDSAKEETQAALKDLYDSWAPPVVAPPTETADKPKEEKPKEEEGSDFVRPPNVYGHEIFQGFVGFDLAGRFFNYNDEITKKLNSAVFPGTQGGPLMHVIAAKAVSFLEALQPEFKVYQQQVLDNARAMATTIIERGINIVSGGTDNHLMLVNLVDKPYTGKDADEALGQAWITVNKNAVPGDPRPPAVTSGFRVGTPAITTRGFGLTETVQLAHWICDVLDSLEKGDSARVIPATREKVKAVCARFPVYG